MSNFQVNFLVEGLTELVGAFEDGSLLDTAIRSSLHETADLLDERAVANMWAGFKNPSGALEGSTYPVYDSPSPYASEVFVESPYAWRREEGFSGMTDSLGRFYPDDPGIHYSQNAIDGSLGEVRAVWVTNLNIALELLGSKLRVH